MVKIQKTIDESFRYFSTEKGKEISKHFFVKFTNCTDVSKIEYKDLWKIQDNRSNDNREKKSRSVPYVNKLFNFWNSNECNFMDIIKIKKTIVQSNKKIKHPYPYYRLNLNSVYFYLEKKNIKLSPKEKELLNKYFDNENIRKLMVDWNDEENKSNNNSKTLIDTIIIFLRCRNYYDPDTILKNVFGKIRKKELVEKYEGILDKMEELSEIGNNELFERIDEISEFVPLLFRKT